MVKLKVAAIARVAACSPGPISINRARGLMSNASGPATTTAAPTPTNLSTCTCHSYALSYSEPCTDATAALSKCLLRRPFASDCMSLRLRHPRLPLVLRYPCTRQPHNPLTFSFSHLSHPVLQDKTRHNYPPGAPVETYIAQSPSIASFAYHVLRM